jgi:hypothetical protein
MQCFQFNEINETNIIIVNYCIEFVTAAADDATLSMSMWALSPPLSMECIVDEICKIHETVEIQFLTVKFFYS